MRNAQYHMFIWAASCLAALKVIKITTVSLIHYSCGLLMTVYASGQSAEQLCRCVIDCITPEIIVGSRPAKSRAAASPDSGLGQSTDARATICRPVYYFIYYVIYDIYKSCSQGCKMSNSAMHMPSKAGLRDRKPAEMKTLTITSLVCCFNNAQKVPATKWRYASSHS
jgi:hypothetical protein